MYISSMQLEYFRSFKETPKLSLSRKFNVFVGKNDSGKSAFLESLQIFLWNMPQSYEYEKDIYNDEDHFEVIIDTVGLTRKDIVIQNLDIDNKHTELRMRFERSSVKPQSQVFVRQNGHKNEGGLFVSNRPNGPAYFFNGRRDLTLGSNVGSYDRMDINPIGKNAGALVDSIVGAAGKKRTEFDNIIEKFVRYRIGTAVGRENGKSIGKSNKIDKEIAAPRMGAGISELAFLIAHLVDAKDKVFVIDELEKSYHPTLLKEVLNIIREKADSNNLQFLIATHSNIVLTHLGALQESKVFEITQYENDESEIEEITTMEERQRVLFDLGYASSDFQCYEGFIITEESSADSFISKIVIPRFFPELVSKIKAVSSTGADDIKNKYIVVRELYRIYFLNHSFKNTTWVICDGDEKGDNVLKDLREKFGKQDDYFLQLEKAKVLEHYYPERIVNDFLKSEGFASLQDILGLKDKGKRSELKTKLLFAVINDTDLSDSDLRKSASFIIGLLGQIAAKMSVAQETNVKSLGAGA